MIDEKLLKILICPENRTSLYPADQGLLARLNRSIGAGRVKNRLGQTIQTQVRQGLVREDGTLLYPIVDEVPSMMVDEAIELEQIE